MSIEENGHTNGEMEEVSAGRDSTAERSFDDLARGAATGTVPRRKALGMLAAALFGGAFVAAPAMAAPRDNRKPGGTGCPKAGQIRNANGQCECQSQLVTCGSAGNESCVDPNTCGGGQRVNTTSCKCECINANETLCPGTKTCVSNACPEGAVLETSGSSCSCQCRNTAKEIVNTPAGAQCVCKTDITCAGTGEVIDPDTCACGCPPATIRCGGNCVAECLEGFVLKNCECVEEVTCAGICEGCCDQGTCFGGTSATACGTGGGACISCPEPPANAQAVCNNGACGVACNSGFTLINGACCANANVCGGVCLTSGCCAAGVEQPGNTSAACGTGGGACATCTSGQTCTSGTCVATSTCRTRGQSCNSGSQQCCSGLTCTGSGSSRQCA